MRFNADEKRNRLMLLPNGDDAACQTGTALKRSQSAIDKVFVQLTLLFGLGYTLSPKAVTINLPYQTHQLSTGHTDDETHCSPGGTTQCG
jgi:hypothetical protein